MHRLKIIIGSTRPGRAADRGIPWITSAARAHGGFEVEVIDLRDWEPSDTRTNAAAKILLDDLAWWAAALKQARAQGTLPPAIMRLMAANEGPAKK